MKISCISVSSEKRESVAKKTGVLFYCYTRRLSMFYPQCCVFPRGKNAFVR